MLIWVAIVSDCVGTHATLFHGRVPTHHGPGGDVEINVLGTTEDLDAALEAVVILQKRLEAQKRRRRRRQLRLVVPSPPRLQ